MIGIYKITSPNNKVYIGQSVNIKQRFGDYRKPSYFKRNNQHKLRNSINKYGIEKHKFEVITECSIEELNILELYYQELYNSVKKGMNCVYVDESNGTFLHTEETKRKISEGNKGNKKWLGKKHSEHTKQLISNMKKGVKRNFSEEAKKNIILASSRPVYQIDFDSKKIINKFASIKEASLITNCSKTNISKLCSGSIKKSIKKVGGFLWCYIEDYDIKYK